MSSFRFSPGPQVTRDPVMRNLVMRHAATDDTGGRPLAFLVTAVAASCAAFAAAPASAIQASAAQEGVAQEVVPAAVTIVSQEVAVSGSEATLRLGFSDGRSLAISFRDQVVEIDGQPIGELSSSSLLESSWRSLLGQAVSLVDAPLAEALADWAPPGELEGNALELATRIDSLLESLGPDGISNEVGDVAANAATGQGTAESAAEVIAAQFSVGDLLDLVRDIDLDDIKKIISRENADLSAGETWEGPVLVFDGDLNLAGTIDGDLLVVDGTLSLLESGRVTGDIHLLDAELAENLGTVGGTIQQIELFVDRQQIVSELRDQLRAEVRQDVLRDVERRNRTQRRSSSWVSRATRAVGDGIESVLLFIVLTLLGGVVIHFASNKLEVIADTARDNPIRSGVVGLAGAFLIVPVFVLGFAALFISIIGWVAIPLWALVYPMALGIAVLLGYLAVARNVGEWLSNSRYGFTEWIRPSNPFYTVTAGIGAMLLLFVLASVARMLPFFGFLQGLLAAMAAMVTFAAISIGFGAVLLTRGGRHPGGNGKDFEFDDFGWPPRPSPDVTSSDETVEAEWTEESEEPAASEDEASSDEAEETDGREEGEPFPAWEENGEEGAAEDAENSDEKS